MRFYKFNSVPPLFKYKNTFKEEGNRNPFEITGNYRHLLLENLVFSTLSSAVLSTFSLENSHFKFIR